MDIGVAVPFSHRTSVEYIASAVSMIEDLGFTSLWVPEHVLFFPEYESRYPYSGDGRIPGEPNGILDPFTALTFVAAHTKKLRLGTGICLVPQRQPVYTAKMVADLDYLSNGRFEFGIGIGWLKEEFDSLQMSFKDRAKRCDEYVGAMQALWTQELASFQGETVHFENCYFNPKPVQDPYPPIFFGGESNAALDRVARMGNGWYGYNMDPNSARQGLDALDKKLEAAGRSKDSIKRYVGPGGLRVTPDLAKQYAELGFDQMILPLFATDLDDLERRATRLLEATAA